MSHMAFIVPNSQKSATVNFNYNVSNVTQISILVIVNVHTLCLTYTLTLTILLGDIKTILTFIHMYMFNERLMADILTRSSQHFIMAPSSKSFHNN